MSDSETWIEKRLASAVKSANGDAHEIPEAVLEELQKLLSGRFQDARKPSVRVVRFFCRVCRVNGTDSRSLWQFSRDFRAERHSPRQTC